MANAWSNPTTIAKETIAAFTNKLTFANLVHRGYEKEWEPNDNGYKPGQAITIKEPAYASVVDGLTVSPEDIRERTRTLTLNNGKSVAFTLTSLELAYNINEIRRLIIEPAVRALANQVETDLAALYKKAANQLGTPGTVTSDFNTYAQAKQYLTEYGVDEEDLYLVVNPRTHAALANEHKGLFLQNEVGKMYKRGRINGMFAGFGEVYSSNHIRTHTVGTWGSGTVLVDDTVADGDATMNLDQNGAGSALTVKQGDIFTVANVNAVNAELGDSLARSRQFVVDADATFADAGGGDFNLDITCTPGTSPHQMYETTSYKNMDALPANNAAVTVVGTSGQQYPVNLAFHKNALTLAMRPLPVLDSAVWHSQESHQGITISVMKYLTGNTRSETIRFDILYVADLLQPDGVVRVVGG
jgi:hypothetical protein